MSDLIRDYEREVREHPNKADAHNNLAHALARKGRLADAVKEWRRVLALAPDYGPAQRAINLAQERLAQTKGESGK